MRRTQLGARGWLRMLWVWWLLLASLGLGLIGLGFSNNAIAELAQRQADLQAKAQQLGDAFAPLRQRQLEVPLALFNDFRAGRLSLDRLTGERLLAAPFFKLYYLDAHGRAALKGDHGSAPAAWLVRLLPGARGAGQALVPLRPQPGLRYPAGTPGSFLLWVGRNPRGEYLVAQTDLDYVFKSWLPEQLSALKLDASTLTELLDTRASWVHEPPSQAHHGTRWLLRALAGQPLEGVRVGSFFPEDAAPFQQLRLSVAPGVALARLERFYGFALAAFALVMVSFALSLFLAARTLRKELALAEARTNFTAMVSHELKTPVAAIRLYGEILVNKLVEDAQKQADYHGIILEQATRLQRLIENLLDLGKIESGSRNFELVPLALNGLVEEAIAHARQAMPEGADYRLVQELTATVPHVRADQDAARQAIANVVHNALKYGGSPADVTVRTRREGDSVLVEVLDRGAGIPAGRRQAIFEPYVRLESEARRETQGTGLGLALVRGYMSGQGGRVEAGDRPDGGSIFTLRFNIAEST